MRGRGARALRATDRLAAAALVDRQFGVTRYASRMRELLELALPGTPDAEYTGLVTGTSGADAVAGLVVFGAVTGAHGVVKVHLLCGGGAQFMRVLLDAVCSTSEGARLVVCELPDDACCVNTADALAGGGFVTEGVVPDYYAEGIGLRMLVRRFPAEPVQ